MIKELYHWYDLSYGRITDVDVAFTSVFNDVPVIYFNLFERDELDTLQLMHGRQVNLISLWDWFDEVWDTVHDRRQNYTLVDCFHNVLSTQRYLPEVMEKMDHYAMTQRKKNALAAYERRNDKPIYFTGSLKEFLT